MKLKFSPNPHFRSPSREAQVFHDRRQKRLAELSGHLIQAVKFGGGLLGHLDKGGQFNVKQEQVSPGFWELTVLNVQMQGKALFFKTIGVQQKMLRTGSVAYPRHQAAFNNRSMIADRTANLSEKHTQRLGGRHRQSEMLLNEISSPTGNKAIPTSPSHK